MDAFEELRLRQRAEKRLSDMIRMLTHDLSEMSISLEDRNVEHALQRLRGMQRYLLREQDND